MSIEPLGVTAYTLTNALGPGCEATCAALLAGRSGLRPCDLPHIRLDTWVGTVARLHEVRLPPDLAHFDCRNNRLAELTLAQDGFGPAVLAARQHYGAERIGVFLGTSTSGLAHTEDAYRRMRLAGGERLDADLRFAHTQANLSLAAFCRARLGLTGPAQVVSTACSSSAKVFATAQRHLAAGLCDAALVGGVDTLCATTLYGFASLELLAPTPCRPWGRERCGLSLAEGAGFALLERARHAPGRPALLGYGESSDAHHISSPHPDGAGAARAMQSALRAAGLDAAAIDYLNLHATATPANDRAEDRAVARCLPGHAGVSATKGWTGHTLGASGITEAVICLLALERGFLPGTLNRGAADPELTTEVLETTIPGTPAVAMTNSFGFGGTNCSLIFGYPG